jgi:hypothetical protein
MNTKPLSQAQDEDVRHVLAALQRATVRARQLAAQTQTGIVIMRDGEIIIEQPEALHRNDNFN